MWSHYKFCSISTWLILFPLPVHDSISLFLQIGESLNYIFPFGSTTLLERYVSIFTLNTNKGIYIWHANYICMCTYKHKSIKIDARVLYFTLFLCFFFLLESEDLTQPSQHYQNCIQFMVVKNSCSIFLSLQVLMLLARVTISCSPMILII